MKHRKQTSNQKQIEKKATKELVKNTVQVSQVNLHVDMEGKVIKSIMKVNITSLITLLSSDENILILIDVESYQLFVDCQYF